MDLWCVNSERFCSTVSLIRVEVDGILTTKFYQLPAATAEIRQIEQERTNNRIKFKLGFPFRGQMDGHELDVYGHGTKTRSCSQLHWVPYANPTAVEKLIPGWRMETTFPSLLLLPPNDVTPKKPAFTWRGWSNSEEVLLASCASYLSFCWPRRSQANINHKRRIGGSKS
ncbi:hypothetical protein H257_02779 [Aphanomyces astaci]|uniref:Uncharacterized protein n=1 Tax=Aphanomyces astaci TaxID=112090 RepID=W4H476_APHAT|nr:hypothetical protein H257_02779 [Aphanomyces astaci]ETV86406.1 hypothetical protein H257_02779 [Aphanomyces astaci]|eukprot:XP_009824878.1 hypothetical protein H257_02779 [Aphanomyces astaci]